MRHHVRQSEQALEMQRWVVPLVLLVGWVVWIHIFMVTVVGYLLS
jgi:hypothetical protein